jgi:hypothetical protein
MSIRKISWATFVLLLLALSVNAQDAPRSVQAKFLKDTTPTITQKQDESQKCNSLCKTSKILFVGSSVFEGSMSYRATRHNAVESNPLLRDGDGFSVTRYALLSTGEYVGLQMLEKHHSKAATRIRLVLVAVKVIAGAWAMRY